MQEPGNMGSSPIISRPKRKLVGKTLMKNLLRRGLMNSITCDSGNKCTSLNGGREHYSE